MNAALRTRTARIALLAALLTAPIAGLTSGALTSSAVAGARPAPVVNSAPNLTPPSDGDTPWG
jgi:hypothetical protein